MTLTALKASKGTCSVHYIAFSLLAPICVLLGTGLAPSINWFHAGLLCIATLVTYTIGHCIHDLSHATSEYKTLSRRGLKTLAIILAIISAGFVVYFVLTVSLWILASAAVIPLVVLYRRGLIYSPFCFSGGIAVCVLGGYFVQEVILSFPAILMALFVLLLGHGGIMLYKIDEWGFGNVDTVEGVEKIQTEQVYNQQLTYIGLIALSFLPLMLAVLLD